MRAKHYLGKVTASVVTLAVLGGLTLRYMAHGEEPAPAPALVPAALALVRQVPYTYYQVAIGQIEARQQVLLSAEVSGQVVALAFDSGDRVKAGNVVVRLNTSPEEGELTRLRGEFEAAKTHYARLQALARNGAESQRALDSARAQFDAAKGNLENIQAQIAQKTIRAPFSGELGIRQVHLGDYVQAGRPLATLTDLNGLRVNFTVSERDSASIVKGQAVEVAVDAWGGMTFEGVVSAIDPQVNNSHVIRVQALLKDHQDKLRPGMYAKVKVQLPGKDELVVPETAITYNAYGESVFVTYEENGQKKVRRKNISIGERRDGLAVVLKGLQAGEEVVTSGQIKLQDGVAIEPVTDTVRLNVQR
ncbi:efflux RND transporter periplasmic adaptor subunit [Pseudomonas sp. FFUP_PS_473]|jgi:multidrug efflux system membrane fusion protein|uniref:efflux RND transporter periplasmic adaptor subunit n=1 Tax=Pseudomonas TaxID=286 RepID=UPI0008116B70|nr:MULTISPECIES: efflux RND transporter periplasmic adaptor subunit [Pseudomonas]PLP89504.1 efflux RND transporter periplasmic adaptor subunit [Pseudomonas sp. FFUP_PS_473]WJM95095.1 efflux RND transporter periplasmic adaptor subunit [Pseudomonas defluvii]